MSFWGGFVGHPSLVAPQWGVSLGIGQIAWFYMLPRTPTPLCALPMSSASIKVCHVVCVDAPRQQSNAIDYLYFWHDTKVSTCYSRGLIHTTIMQFFTLGSQKMVVLETYLFDIVITDNDRFRQRLLD